MPFFAVVFKRDFQPGEHWYDHRRDPKPGQKHDPRRHRARPDDPDRTQHWKAGDLYSTGTVIDKLPDHLEAIEFAEAPAPGSVWDAVSRTFVVP